MTKYKFVQWCVDLVARETVYTGDRIPPQGHMNGYDFNKLESMLKTAGFKSVVSSSYRQSSVPDLTHPAFDNRPVVSLFVEACK